GAGFQTQLAQQTGGTLTMNVSGSNTLFAINGGASTELDIGWNGFVNFVISGGAGVTNSGTAWVSRNGASCSNNSVLVTGASSTWQYGGAFRMGFAALNNTMTISDGALVNGGTADFGGGAGSSNNVVVVTGSNSTWSTRGSFIVGSQSRLNT